MIEKPAPRSGFLPRPGGHRLAWKQIPPASRAAHSLVWLSGFGSEMTGTKASHLAQWAQNQPFAFWRFDYFGCGASSGAFGAATIGRWRADVLAVLDQLIPGPALLAGSSMGAWLALLAARDRPRKIRGLFLLAPAPDFTRLLPPQAPPAARDGEIPISPGLIAEAQNHFILGAPIPLACPVHILHGMADQTVPLAHVLDLAAALDTPDLVLTLVKRGDHRLSTPADLNRLTDLLGRFCRAGEDGAPSP